MSKLIVLLFTTCLFNLQASQQSTLEQVAKGLKLPEFDGRELYWYRITMGEGTCTLLVELQNETQSWSCTGTLDTGKEGYYRDTRKEPKYRGTSLDPNPKSGTQAFYLLKQFYNLLPGPERREKWVRGMIKSGVCRGSSNVFTPDTESKSSEER